jgi:hypothetical protein
MELAGGKTVAHRRGRGVASRHEPGERVLILDECRLARASEDRDGRSEWNVHLGLLRRQRFAVEVRHAAFGDR